MVDKPSDRAERAYASLRAAIIEAALEPDVRLGEEALAEHYGISRTLIRSVLARLVSEGLADTGHGRSVRVAHPTKDEAREAFAVRWALERSALEELAALWSSDVERRLRAHVQAEREALAEQNSLLSSRLANEFHIEIASATGNTLLQRYTSEVVSRTALIIAIYGKAINQRSSIDEHDELLDLLAAGKVDEAVRLAGEHLRAVEYDTLSTPESSGPGDLTSILSRYSERV